MLSKKTVDQDDFMLIRDLQTVRCQVVKYMNTNKRSNPNSKALAAALTFLQEPKPEPTPEPKPEFQPEPQSEPQSKSQSEPVKRSRRLKATVESKPKPEPQPKPEPVKRGRRPKAAVAKKTKAKPIELIEPIEPIEDIVPTMAELTVAAPTITVPVFELLCNLDDEYDAACLAAFKDAYIIVSMLSDLVGNSAMIIHGYMRNHKDALHFMRRSIEPKYPHLHIFCTQFYKWTSQTFGELSGL